MHPRRPVPAEVLRLAREQDGAVSREQCLALGLADWQLRRLCGEGLWRRLASGVYATSPVPPAWGTRVWAGLLVGGDDALVAGRAAAHLHGFEPNPPQRIRILVAADRRVRQHLGWEFRRTTHLPPGMSRGGPPRTAPADTVLQLVADEPHRMEHWVTAAVNGRSTTVPELRDAVERRARIPRRSEWLALLADVDAGAMSKLELLYLRSVERAHGLPVGRRQVRGLRYVTDVEYEQGLLVELDGRLGHGGAGRFRDMARDNHHTLLRRSTLRYGWDDCRHRPCEVARQVAGVLNALGWAGTPTRCRSCRRVFAA